MATPLYQLKNITHAYGDRSVLSVPELAIYSGEILAVVGPSGAGKSTFLRLLNFLEPPTQGRIHFGGTAVNGSREAPLWLRRQVTTVFQKPLLLRRSVESNVAYGLRLRGRRDRERVTAALGVERVVAGRGARLLAHYERGPSPLGQFFRTDETAWGVGIGFEL